MEKQRQELDRAVRACTKAALIEAIQKIVPDDGCAVAYGIAPGCEEFRVAGVAPAAGSPDDLTIIIHLARKI